MQTFIDDGVSRVSAGETWDSKGKLFECVYFDITNSDTGAVATGCFTKQELKELIKLIEESN